MPELEASGLLDRRAILYRLDYGDGRALLPYGTSRWSAPVVELVHEFAGTPWRSGPGAPPVPLAPEDVLVVAAYNAQVDLIGRELAAAGLRDEDGGAVAFEADGLAGAGIHRAQ